MEIGIFAFLYLEINLSPPICKDTLDYFRDVDKLRATTQIKNVVTLFKLNELYFAQGTIVVAIYIILTVISAQGFS